MNLHLRVEGGPSSILAAEHTRDYAPPPPLPALLSMDRKLHASSPDPYVYHVHVHVKYNKYNKYNNENFTTKWSVACQ